MREEDFFILLLEYVFGSHVTLMLRSLASFVARLNKDRVDWAASAISHLFVTQSIPSRVSYDRIIRLT